MKQALNEVTTPFIGIDSTMSNEDYHAHPAIGSSGIKLFLESPEIYHYEYISGHKKDSNAQNYGTAAHCYMLEPQVFEERFIIAPKEATGRNKKVWKLAVKEAVNQGKTCLLPKEWEQLQAMRNKLMQHKIARGMLLAKGSFELTAFAIDEETGLHIKARPDRIVDDMIIDYKTTAISLGLTAQQRLAYGLSRHVQGAHHKNVMELATGTPINKVLHLVQMTEPPYLVRVFNLSPDLLAYGKREVDRALLEIAECQRTGIYPGYPDDEIEDLNLPNWAGTEIN